MWFRDTINETVLDTQRFSYFPERDAGLPLPLFIDSDAQWEHKCIRAVIFRVFSLSHLFFLRYLGIELRRMCVERCMGFTNL